MKWLSFFLLVLFLVAVFILLKSELFSIKQVVVSSSPDCGSADEIKKESKLLNRNFFDIQGNLTPDLQQKFVCIKKVNISKSFPNTLTLDIIERKEAAKLLVIPLEASRSSVATPSAQWVVDDEGVIFSSQAKEQSLAQLMIFDGDLKLGGRLDGNLIVNSLEVLSFLQFLNLNTNQVKIFPDYSLVIDGGARIVFDLTKDIKRQLASLQLIMEGAKIEERKMDYIDLRFDKPIVKYSKQNGQR